MGLVFLADLDEAFEQAEWMMLGTLISSETEKTSDKAAYHLNSQYTVEPLKILKGEYLSSSLSFESSSDAVEITGNGDEHDLETGKEYVFFASQSPESEGAPHQVFRVEERSNLLKSPRRVQEVFEERMGSVTEKKSVNSIALYSEHQGILCSSQLDPSQEDLFRSFAAATSKWMSRYSGQPTYWVSESEGGIVVLQFLEDAYIVIVVGEKGANFPVVRYTLDKLGGKLNSLLRNRTKSLKRYLFFREYL